MNTTDIILYETIFVENGKIRLAELHFERLFKGLQLLGGELPPDFTAQKIEAGIKKICGNIGSAKARVRLSASIVNGNLVHGAEAKALESGIEWEKDLKIDIYPHARKICNAYSNLKNSDLCYTMAHRHAKQHRIDDCIV